jgi:hypothetical protein
VAGVPHPHAGDERRDTGLAQYLWAFPQLDQQLRSGQKIFLPGAVDGRIPAEIDFQRRCL